MRSDINMTHMLSFWATKSFVDAAILRAALQLHFFEMLPSEGQGTVTVAELAARLGTSERGTRVMCEPLVSSALLVRDAENKLSLTASVVPQLHDPATLAYLRGEAVWWQPSAKLAEAVRTNAPVSYNGKMWDILAHYRAMISTIRLVESPVEATVVERVKHFFLYTQALIAAATLKLFAQIGDTPVTLSALAGVLHLPEAGLAVLLDTLTEMQVLVRTSDGYIYPTTKQKDFTPPKLAAYSQLLHVTALQWEAFGRLDQAIIHNKRVLDLHDAALGGQFYAALARYNTSIFPSYFHIARGVPRALRELRPEGQLAVLDVGAGSGVWGAAFAYLDPYSNVTFFDQGPVLAQAKRNVERLGCLQRASFEAGDLLQADFGQERYDIIVLGQICHTQLLDTLPMFLMRLRRALRSGGYLVIADLILNERRDGPLDYLYFNVKEFMSTGGEVLSLSEYHRLLMGAGFSAHRAYALAGIDVIIAVCGDIALPARLEHQTQRVIEIDPRVQTVLFTDFGSRQDV